jgi:proline iminopeptidase
MFKKIITVVFVLGLIISTASLFSQFPVASDLYPELKPYKTGYLKVSELHEIFYQLGGKQQGKPVMVLHGGPGGGCSSFYFRYFNPEKFHIILHDQRGASQSKPYAELKENTTQKLVEDIEKLRTHLNLSKVILFGGSWGTTLALAYAETYPQNVSGMVLRGVFTATKDEIDHYYYGGTAKFFPENYEELLSYIDSPDKRDFPAQLVEKLQPKDMASRVKYSKAWAKYEGKIAFLEIADERIDQMLKGLPPYALAVLENYYMANNCFLREGELLNNADKLVNIPVIIINGRYDMICPPITAYKLHKKLPKSKLIIVERAGHSATEPGIQAELVKAMHSFED